MDDIYESFLRVQAEEGLALAAASDLLDLVPVGPRPFNRFIARYSCRGLVCADGGGEPQIGEVFQVGFQFPSDYLRSVRPFEVVCWLGPTDIFHPNAGIVGPFDTPLFCTGAIRPGTPLVELLERSFDIITYRNLTMAESDALNHAACAWARKNQHRFPIDPRPLRRRALEMQVEVTA